MPLTASPLDLFARQSASVFVQDYAQTLQPEQQQQLLGLYHSALLRAFGEVAQEPESGAPWHAMRVATRAQAYTFGERANEVLHVLNVAPTRTVRELAQAIERVVGKDMLVLRRYAEGAPPAPPPPSATFVVDATAVQPHQEKSMNAQPPRPDMKLTERLSNEANEAAWLIFAGKSVEVAQQSLGAFLQRNLADGDPALRAKIGILMETKLGEVLTALVLSAAAQTFGATLAEQVGVSQGRMDHLASKLRVHAIASGGKALLDELTTPFLAQLTDLIRAMPDDAPAMLADHQKVDERRAEPVRAAAV